MQLIIMPPEAKFKLGQVVLTPGVEGLDNESLNVALWRHASGDWGDVPPEDKRANDRDLKAGERLLSAYKAADGTKFWIITEWDRSYTTILLPEEY